MAAKMWPPPGDCKPLVAFYSSFKDASRMAGSQVNLANLDLPAFCQPGLGHHNTSYAHLPVSCASLCG